MLCFLRFGAAFSFAEAPAHDDGQNRWIGEAVPHACVRRTPRSAAVTRWSDVLCYVKNAHGASDKKRGRGMRILVVDDEAEIADLVEIYLKNEGYEVVKCYRGDEALAKIASTPIDLAVLDVMLPGADGFTICRKIRESYNFPVIMLTARQEDIDKITGLTIGADDYITKPFNPLELVARIKAQLRRYTRYNGSVHADDGATFDFGGLVIKSDTHECTLYGKEVRLTPIEFKILWMLCEADGRVVSSEELFEKVWGEKYLDSNNTVMVHIRRLREKLHEKPRDPKFIKTVWGVGYKIGK